MPSALTRSARTRSWPGGGLVAGDCLGAGVVGGGRGGPVGQGAVEQAGVVDRGEGVQQGLQLGDGLGLVPLGGQPFLEGLLEPLGFALGLGVVRAAVLLFHAEAAQLGFQAVGAGRAGEPCGVDQAVEFLSGVKQFGGVWS